MESHLSKDKIQKENEAAHCMWPNPNVKLLFSKQQDSSTQRRCCQLFNFW